MKKICILYNFAQHYRTSIFSLIDKEFDCDFVFGDKYLDVKKVDYSLLKSVEEVQNINFHGIKWQRGALKYAFKKYDAYLALGEPSNVVVWLLMIICRLCGKSVYLWTHGRYGKESKFRTIIEKAFYGLSTGVLLYGTYAKKLMIDVGISEKKLHVIYNSLDYDSQLIQRKKIKSTRVYQEYFQNNNHNLIFVGRLTQSKRLDMIIDAMVMAKNQGRLYNCTFIGDGDARDFLKDKVNGCGLEEAVWFYGACYAEDELANMIYNADLCVSPGNIGLTAIHSLAYGCPVVTHNNYPYQGPEFEAIIPTKTGAFFQYNQVESLCQTINDWFSLQVNRETVRQMAYQEIDAHWNPYSQIKKLKSIID